MTAGDGMSRVVDRGIVQPGTQDGSSRRAVAILVVTLTSAPLALIGGWWAPISWLVAAALAPLVVAAWIDAHEYRLPDRWVALGIVPVVTAVVPWLAAGQVGHVVGVAAGGAAVVVPVLLVHLVAPAALGFGDVKAIAVVGSALGLVEPRLGLVALCIASGATAVWALGLRRPSVPLGPGLVVGAFGALVLARVVGVEAPLWP